MRLIDADQLQKDFNIAFNGQDGITISKISADIIGKQETVDAKPVVHGKWIECEYDFEGCYYSCSVCKNDWVCIEGTPKDNNMNYCPYCGAKMDLEDTGDGN